MLSNIILACSERDTKKITVDNAFSLYRENQICICKNISDLFKASRYASDTAIVFDKYFMGFIMSDTLKGLKMMNDKLSFYFVEVGECSPYLAMRTKKLGADGFISGIEFDNNCKNGLLKVREGIRTFPKEIQPYIDKKEKIDSKLISDVTPSEKIVGIGLTVGKTQKEISFDAHIARQNVSLYKHRLLKKIGYREPRDMYILFERSFDNYEEDNFDY